MWSTCIESGGSWCGKKLCRCHWLLWLPAETFHPVLCLHSEMNHLKKPCQHNTEVLVRYQMGELDQQRCTSRGERQSHKSSHKNWDTIFGWRGWIIPQLSSWGKQKPLWSATDALDLHLHKHLPEISVRTWMWRLFLSRRDWEQPRDNSPMSLLMSKWTKGNGSFLFQCGGGCFYCITAGTLPEGEVKEKFGVHVNFPDLPSKELTKQCETLSNFLSCGGQSDLDGRELASEIQTFPDLPKANMTTLKLLAFLQEKKLKEVYPNMWVALRITITIPVTVAAAEGSFSKLKLIKIYLRFTMSQERLDGHALISINCEVLRIYTSRF